jgi:hypothetical protein
VGRAGRPTPPPSLGCPTLPNCTQLTRLRGVAKRSATWAALVTLGCTHSPSKPITHQDCSVMYKMQAGPRLSPKAMPTTQLQFFYAQTASCNFNHVAVTDLKLSWKECQPFEHTAKSASLSIK